MRTVAHSLPYKPELDGLRGIAIAVVVLFHLWPRVFPFGFAGVDIFFVLSGYLITKVIVSRRREGHFRYSEFYRNRIRRIFPAMIAVLATTLVAGALLFYQNEFERLASHVESSAFFFQNVRLGAEGGYWDEAGELKPLLHFWSLSIEEQFYTFWPLLVGLLMTPGAARFAGMALLVPVFLRLPVASTEDPFFRSSARFWELGIGGLAVALERIPVVVSVLGRLRAAPPLVLILGLALARDAPGSAFLPLLITTLATGAWVIRLGDHEEPLLRNRALVFLGLISFPLYLWHYPIMSFMRVMGHPPEDHGAAVLAASIGLAFLTYYFIETFSRRQTHPAFMSLLVALVVLVGLAGRFAPRMAADRPWFRDLREAETQLLRPPPSDAACRRLVNGLLSHDTTFAYCRVAGPDASAPPVAVVGDSHADVAFPGFAAELGTRGLSSILLAGSGCPALAGAAVGRDRTEIDACAGQIDDIYGVLDRLPNLAGVIFVARGPTYMTGEGFGRVDRRGAAQLIFRRTFEQGPSFRAADEYIAALEASLRHFQDRTPTFVVLENPELGFSARACLPRPLGVSARDCSVSRAAYAERMGEYRRRVFALAARFPDATVLDPEPVFCETARCRATDNGALLYIDDDHLSLRGSTLQARAFIDLMAAKIRRPEPPTRAPKGP